VRLISIGLTIIIAILTITALTLVLYGGEIGDALANRFGFSHAFTVAWAILQWPIVLAFVLLAFALVYYYAPDVHDQKWYWITPGSLVGVLLWLLVSFIFRLYLSYFDNYSVTYGSLGAVIILMLWFYLSGCAILIGGGVNAEIENAAAHAGAPDAKRHGRKKPKKKG
jgi:membrane protein